MTNPTHRLAVAGTPSSRWLRFVGWAALPLSLLCPMAPAMAQTDVADVPLLATKNVPGNVALALSVEFPTAVSVAHLGDYVSATTYIGYFDPNKCYDYVFSAVETERHFAPGGLTPNHQCASPKWSGNFLNWATMQTIDPFRWVLTGGFRVVDTPTVTILEKATASGQGGVGNFPNRTLATGVAAATGTNLSPLRMRVQGLGNKLRFTQNGDVNAANPTPFNPANAGSLNVNTVFEVSVRVKVCDPSGAGGGVELFNCVRYPNGNFKPEGLIQKFSNKLRLSAFGYLNDSDVTRDGGVLRARQKFVGPTQPVPGEADEVNPAAEWSPSTGVFITNPDAVDAASTGAAFGTTITNSGVINYLNKFGQLNISALGSTYKAFDPVGELYYAAVRYFKNQGNVAEWTALNGKSGAVLADGFPVIRNFDDPIQFSCQKNFILGIGDVNTHADRNLPGSTGASEPARPGAVTADTTVNAVAETNRVGVMEGLGANLGNTSPYNGCCSNNGALIAGLAYDAHTRDIRRDIADKQTIDTYWLDVLEFLTFKNNNQYYLATKFGGFDVPEGFNPDTATADLPEELWHTNGQSLGRNKLPDNYFVAANPDQIVSGLTRAFSDIASQVEEFGTTLGLAQPQVAETGNANFSVEFDFGKREGEVTASELSFSATGVPSLATRWKFTERLATQLANGGFDTNRRVITINPDANAGRGQGTPFRFDSLTTAQKTALDTPFRLNNDAADYLNYLRGDRTHEEGQTAAASAKIYRQREVLVGDIVGSKAVPVGPPNTPFNDAANPGYSAFRTANATRPTVVYFGGNDGMLHAVDGSLTGVRSGTEIFAYVPNAVYNGPDGTPGVNGLAAIGNREFTGLGEFFFVNATPAVFDMDLNRTAGRTGGAADWRSVLIGGLGKGGRSYYAIDVTDPNTMRSTEASAASKVLWEFTDPDLGFTFGEPAVVKTAKYGWVVIFGSGYNNRDNQGYFFIVNPRNGALLEKLSTGVGNTANPAGLAHVSAYVVNFTDGTADAAYAGDLLGNIWRLDLTPSGNQAFTAPTRIASLTDAAGQPQPVTTRVLVEVQPVTNKRFVMLGTGRFLGNSDVGSRQRQSFYAITDGNAFAFNALLTAPVVRTDLIPVTNLTAGVTVGDLAGWFIDLTDPRAADAQPRVIIDPRSFNGVVIFSTLLPNNDPCEAVGSGQGFAVNFGTGQSILKDARGTIITSLQFSAPVIENSVLSLNRAGGGSGEAVAAFGTSDGKLETSGLGPVTLPLRRINWRELPTVQ
jgi:type IV pilus assembly protein PilY1